MKFNKNNIFEYIIINIVNNAIFKLSENDKIKSLYYQIY